jgi:IclR family acetate operon transcriptional repressor
MPASRVDDSARNRPRSSDRVLQLLCVVGGAAHGLSLTEAATRVGLVPSTALRQLRSLEASGLLVRSELDQLYRPGPALVKLSRTVFAGQSLASAAQPFLESLARTTGESAYLAISEGAGKAVYVATAPGEHALRHSGWLGRAFTSSGTAAGAALRGRTDNDGAVARVGKLEPGITAVGASVRTPTGVIAAINVVGPSFRLEGRQLEAIRRAVVAAAAQLSETLGQPD